ncbi:kinase-like protein [Nemania sp. FL0031]|nr:kinase-like protein [Nemania sp. FL0031]
MQGTQHMQSSSESAPGTPPRLAAVSGRPDSTADHNLSIQNEVGSKFGIESQLSHTTTLDGKNDSERLSGEIGNGLNYQTERLRRLVHTAEPSSESGDVHSEMAQALRDKFITSADEKKFLPLDQLEAIVNEHSVQNLLSKVFPSGAPSARDICPHQDSQDCDGIQHTSRRKIFATLVIISRVELISDFIKENIRDADLPLQQRKFANETFLVARGVESEPHSEYALRHGRGRWTYNDIPIFCDQQWAISAPYFSMAEDSGEKVHFYSLSSYDILPFVKPGTDDSGNPAYLNQGFYSTVRRVKIHRAHHNFPVALDHDGADFAVKRLTRFPNPHAENNKKYFELEVEALKKFCLRNERYIIKLLATYEIDGRYHLLFPVADGNLGDLWKTSSNTSPPVSIPGATLWLAQECLGIAQALGKIHQFTFSPPRGVPRDEPLEPSEIRRHGIHGDIKPQNVLWFRKLPNHLQNCNSNSVPDLGFLQLSDFGTVYFHRDRSIMKNEILVKNNSYRAPESDLDGDNGSPALDIWAFGCLYLDFITWFLCGLHAVDQEFPERRTQDEPDPSEPGLPRQDTFFITSRHWFRRKDLQIVKPNVTEWIEHLHKHPKCSQFFHDFLNFIEVHMLVVSPKNRAKCTDIVEELQRLKASCDQDSAYYEAENPRALISFRLNCLSMKRMVKKLGRIVNTHGSMVMAIFILIGVVYFLLRMLGAHGLDLK